MSAYNDMAAAVEAAGISTSALANPTQENTYAVIRMVNHQTELSGDDMPKLFGAYIQVDLFTCADADALAMRIIAAAGGAGFVYRGRSDDHQNNRQHVELRFMKLEEVQ